MHEYNIFFVNAKEFDGVHKFIFKAKNKEHAEELFNYEFEGRLIIRRIEIKRCITKTWMENYNEIGRRLVEVCNKLDEMGVFYGNNYDGKFNEEYPHWSCSYKLSMDKHRGGFMGVI